MTAEHPQLDWSNNFPPFLFLHRLEPSLRDGASFIPSLPQSLFLPPPIAIFLSSTHPLCFLTQPSSPSPHSATIPLPPQPPPLHFGLTPLEPSFCHTCHFVCLLYHVPLEFFSISKVQPLLTDRLGGFCLSKATHSLGMEVPWWIGFLGRSTPEFDCTRT